MSNLQLNVTIGKYTIEGIKTIVHDKYFPNTDITHKVALIGKRGGKATAYIHASGNMGKVMTGNYGYFEGLQ